MKKAFKSLLIILMGSLLFSSCMIGRNSKEEAPVRAITVSGTGSVSVKPDMVALRFIVKNTGWNCPAVAERNALLSTNAINQIKEAGIPDSDISTYNYSITQDNTHSYAGEYTATNTIAVLVRNIDITGKVIDAAVKNNTGANGLTSFEYLCSDSTTALREARTLAIKNAQDAASLLAGASGCKVSGVLEINETNTNTGRSGNMMTLALSNGSVTTPIISGNISITSNVTVKYELTN